MGTTRRGRSRAIPATGWFGNWDHYGYLESVPARVLTEASVVPGARTRRAPRSRGAASRTARRHGRRSARRGRRSARRSARSPTRITSPARPDRSRRGPATRSGSTRTIPNVSRWRSWQNDLAWTEPWGPAIAGARPRRVRDGFRDGLDHWRRPRAAVERPFRAALEADWRVPGPSRRAYDRAPSARLDPTARRFVRCQRSGRRRRPADRLRAIARAERANALAVLPFLERDSRLGFASGRRRGGARRAVHPGARALEVGPLDDLLVRELPRRAVRGRGARRPELRRVSRTRRTPRAVPPRICARAPPGRERHAAQGALGHVGPVVRSGRLRSPLHIVRAAPNAVEASATGRAAAYGYGLAAVELEAGPHGDDIRRIGQAEDRAERAIRWRSVADWPPKVLEPEPDPRNRRTIGRRRAKHVLGGPRR